MALKLLKADLADPSLRARFEREAQVTAGLAHPHIVQVYDFGVDGRRPYLVYELLEGNDLEHAAAATPPPGEDQVLDWAEQIADALQAAHAAGVVHRDVKPANVFLKEGRVPVLCDFGIARVETGAADSLTAEGVLIGSPAYMAAELWTGQDPTPGSDQYAWAMSLYEVLYGQVAFPGMGPVEIMRAVTGGQPVGIPAGFQGRLPGVEQVLLRALQHDPAARFPDMAAFAGALIDARRGSLSDVLVRSGVHALRGAPAEDPRSRSTVEVGAPRPPESTQKSPPAAVVDTQAIQRAPAPSGRLEAPQLASAATPGRSEQGRSPLAPAALALAFVAAALWPTAPAAPEPSAQAAPTPGVAQTLDERLAQALALPLATLREHERALREVLELEPEVSVPDLVVGTSYVTAERGRTGIRIGEIAEWRGRFFGPATIEPWKAFTSAAAELLEEARRWEERHELPAGDALRSPALAEPLWELLAGTGVYAAEQFRMRCEVLAYEQSRDDVVGMGVSIQDYLTGKPAWIQGAVELRDRSRVLWPEEPPAPLVDGVLNLLRVLVLSGEEEARWVDAARRLVPRFEAVPPSRSAYLEGKAALYALCYSTLEVRMKIPELLAQVGRIGRRLLDEASWAGAEGEALGPLRARLLARVLVEQTRLRQFREAQDHAFDDDLLDRLLVAARSWLREDPVALRNAAIAYQAQASSNMPRYSDRQTSDHARWKKPFQALEKRATRAARSAPRPGMARLVELARRAQARRRKDPEATAAREAKRGVRALLPKVHYRKD